MSTVIGVIETGEVTENIIAVLLPHFSAGLRSKVKDYMAATYMILAELFFKVKLKPDLLKTLLNAVCKVCITVSIFFLNQCVYGAAEVRGDTLRT